MDRSDIFMRRINALKRAHQNARNPEFKMLWKNMNNKLIENERERIEQERARKGKYYDSI
jgi:hypothetical protein